MKRRKHPGQGELFVDRGHFFEYHEPKTEQGIPSYSVIQNEIQNTQKKTQALQSSYEHIHHFPVNTRNIRIGEKSFEIKISHTNNHIDASGNLNGLILKIRPKGAKKYWHFVICFCKPFQCGYYTTADGSTNIVTKLGPISSISKTNSVGGHTVFYNAQGYNIQNFNYFSYLFKVSQNREKIHKILIDEMIRYCTNVWMGSQKSLDT